ncbi:MAG TPA: LytTR family DNA-binding domain-containing protein [Puia sp.]|nr:LytTR family DNA-binding domain-containing protein [Puia sp.]
MKLQCTIVDDEPLAVSGLASYVQEVDFLRLAGTCEQPLELMAMMEKEPIDLIFLDIQMPKMNGIEFLRQQSCSPMVIITSAYPSFALEGFRLNVLDYLLKPITFDRFFQAARKARDYNRLLHAPEKAAESDYFFTKCGNKYEKILFDEILFVEGLQNYVAIHTVKGKYITLLSMKSMEEKLDSRQFIRVHRSFIVAISRIDSLESGQLFIGRHAIPISRNLREQVLEKVVSRNLWDRS